MHVHIYSCIINIQCTYHPCIMNEKSFGFLLITISILTFFSIWYSLLWTKIFPPKKNNFRIVNTSLYLHLHLHLHLHLYYNYNYIFFL